MSQVLHGLGADLLTMLAAVLLVAAAAALVLRDGRARSGGRLGAAARAGAVCVLAAVLLLTLAPAGARDGERTANLIPGRGLDPPWASAVAAYNLLGNLLLFVPVGIVLAAWSPRLRNPLTAAVAAAALSAGIEAIQYAGDLGRTADVNDVLANTVGALAGLAAYRLTTGAAARRQRREAAEPAVANQS